MVAILCRNISLCALLYVLQHSAEINLLELHFRQPAATLVMCWLWCANRVQLLQVWQLIQNETHLARVVFLVLQVLFVWCVGLCPSQINRRHCNCGPEWFTFIYFTMSLCLLVSSTILEEEKLQQKERNRMEMRRQVTVSWDSGGSDEAPPKVRNPLLYRLFASFGASTLRF